MQLKRNEEIITHPLPEWIDEAGTKWGNPQLAFMKKKGWVEYVAPVTPLTQAEIFAQAQATLTMTIQNHLDTVARTRNYDGILSLCTYVTSKDLAFAAEGQAGVIFRDACWRKGYEIMTAVTKGLRPIPTASELLAELPLIGWV